MCKKCKTRHIKIPNVVVNNFPKKAVSTYPKHVPSISSYAGIGKKVRILSDSIPSRFIMKEFNYYVEIGHVFRKSFPGATAKDMQFYPEKKINWILL